MALSDRDKWLLTAGVVVVGAPSLPFTAGVSGIVLLGAILAIWGVDWGGS